MKVKKIVNFFKNHFIFFLILVVFISYGQMLGMYVWQDDNALFFKLAHIDEPAGYFAPGIIGIGHTKYAAAPFVPIYQLFRFKVEAYFTLLLIFYLVATLLVYKAFSVVLGNTGGKIAGFLYAAGYVFSDGIWRMANSVTTSISISFISLLLLGYWQFYKEKKVTWYLLALISFFLATELAIIRTHYLFIIAVLFEIIFLTFKNLPKSLLFSAVRLLPFFYIFKNWALAASVNRASVVENFITAFLNGQFYLYYGFLSSIANVVIPDWLTSYLFFIQRFLDSRIHTHVPFLRLLLIGLPAVLILFLLKNHRQKKILLPVFLLSLLTWTTISKKIFISIILQPTLEQYFIVSLGGVLLLIGVLLFIVIGKNRWLLLFLILWILVNIAVYSAYNPTFAYATIERYLAHSFFSLIGVFALLYISLPPKSFFSKVGKVFIILLGIGNLFNAVVYQNAILHNRTFPAKAFYKQLKGFVPVVQKRDVFYFDIAADAQAHYNDAIATAMMPETTAIAWRYGVDRYDIKLVTDFQDFIKTIQTDKTQIKNVHTFWYSNTGLVDTSNELRSFMQGTLKTSLPAIGLPSVSDLRLNTSQEGTFWKQPDIEISFKDPISSVVPLQLQMIISATLPKEKITFPLISQPASLSPTDKIFWRDLTLRNLAIEYGKFRQNLQSQSKINVSSEWQNNIAKNLMDGDITSLWQSDRTDWGNEKTFIQMQLPQAQKIDKVAWINGFSTNTPTGYYIEVSDDGQDWKKVKRVDIMQRVDERVPQVVVFEPTFTQFVRMVITKTFNNDSPVIAEFWVVPSKFNKLDINLTEKFLENPFALVPTQEAFLESLTNLSSLGKIQIFWENNKKNGWQSTKGSEFEIYYDGQPRTYVITIPAGGTQISKLKISNVSIPGIISLDDLTVEPAKIGLDEFK